MSKDRLRTHAHELLALRDWVLRDDRIFANLTFHGNTKWRPVNLVWLALCWAWSESRCLTDAFVEAAMQCGQLLSGSPLSTYRLA